MNKVLQSEHDKLICKIPPAILTVSYQTGFLIFWIIQCLLSWFETEQIFLKIFPVKLCIPEPSVSDSTLSFEGGCIIPQYSLPAPTPITSFKLKYCTLLVVRDPGKKYSCCGVKPHKVRKCSDTNTFSKFTCSHTNCNFDFFSCDSSSIHDNVRQMVGRSVGWLDGRMVCNEFQSCT